MDLQLTFFLFLTFGLLLTICRAGPNRLLCRSRTGLFDSSRFGISTNWKRKGILSLRRLQDKHSGFALAEHNSNDYSQLTNDMKKWVTGMISGFGICPFTASSNIAGTPQGKIRYAVSKARTVEEAFTDYWREVDLVHQSPVADLSTTLLMYPHIVEFSEFSTFDSFSIELDALLSASPSANAIDNVYFHPQFLFRDKDDQVFLVFDDDGNPLGLSNEVPTPPSYARRSPTPMVNILRADMVQKAQRTMKEGQVLRRNNENLEKVGVTALEDMLQRCDWSGLPRKAPSRPDLPLQEPPAGTSSSNSIEATGDQSMTTCGNDSMDDLTDEFLLNLMKEAEQYVQVEVERMAEIKTEGEIIDDDIPY